MLEGKVGGGELLRKPLLVFAGLAILFKESLAKRNTL